MPPFPAGNIVNTSRLRQSRNHEGLSLSISTIYTKYQYVRKPSLRFVVFFRLNLLEDKSTLDGSKLTRPQARAATPRHPCETATIPTESGPGYIIIFKSHYTGSIIQQHINKLNSIDKK